MKKFLPILIGVILLTSAGAFYGGMRYVSAKSPRMVLRGNLTPDQMQRFQANGAGGGAFRVRADGATNGGFVSGEIISNDGKTLTVKMRDGGSKIVIFGDSTEISKFTAGASSDLEAGKTVTIMGKTNDDGSLTAQSVQIRPATPTPPQARP